MHHLDPRTHGCETCRTGVSSGVEQVGEKEHLSFAYGKAREIDTHYKCKKCGAKWVRIVESGFMGRGDFWHPEE